MRSLARMTTTELKQLAIDSNLNEELQRYMIEYSAALMSSCNGNSVEMSEKAQGLMMIGFLICANSAPGEYTQLTKGVRA